MRVLSWNLFGLEERELDLRTEAAMGIALLGGDPWQVLSSGAPVPEPPEVLMFQEVVERSLTAHIRPHLEAAGYVLVAPETPRRWYHEVLALRPPLQLSSQRVITLDSAQGRELLEARVEHEGQTWLLITGHLESLKPGRARRIAQAQQVLDRLRAHPGPAVFGGDTNLRVAEVRSLGPLSDGWEASGRRSAERWTRIRTQPRRTSRYDRFWGHRVRFSGFRCLGRQPVTPSGQPPSDHLGIEVTVQPTGGAVSPQS